MLQLIYELRKNWRGRDGWTGREKSKVLQEVLADLKKLPTGCDVTKNIGMHLGVAQLKSLENASLIKNVDHNIPHLVAKMALKPFLIPFKEGVMPFSPVFGTFCHHRVHGLRFASFVSKSTQLTGPMCLRQLLFVDVCVE